MKRRVGSARFVIETTSENMAPTVTYVRQVLTTAFPRLRNATIALAIYDENDMLVRTVVFGNPSVEMKKEMEFEFGPDDQEVETTTS